MSMIPDLSDEGLVKQFGDVLFEIPELWEALRRFELESRPTSLSGGFNIRSNSISVQRGGGMLRLQVRNSGGMI
ncbi:hypothetical protein GCM10007864_26650 [Sinorhizobium fredii]|nr:hypothetical protein GCM10007864_26650 [Sinorhizobium fredii]